MRPEDETAFSEVRVVGGENMMEEHPVTEGLALFDTGVKVPPSCVLFFYSFFLLGANDKQKEAACLWQCSHWEAWPDFRHALHALLACWRQGLG